MNMESTVDTSAVVTPNCAIAKRSQISSYRMPQKPEMKKKVKYQPMGAAVLWCNLSLPLLNATDLLQRLARTQAGRGFTHAATTTAIPSIQNP